MRCILLLLLMLATQGQAGAWPREKSRVFLSFSQQFENDPSLGVLTTYSALYAEYGLTDKLTLGLDIGGSGVRMSKAVGFLRLPLGSPERQTKLAFELGLGLVDNQGAVRPGFSLGRGLTLGQRQGWIAVDTRGILLKGGKDFLFESDITFGLSATKRTKVILQLQTGAPANQPAYVRFAPSLVIERKPGRHLEIGATVGLKNTSALGLKIGGWIEF